MYAQDIGQAYQFVHSGNAPSGFVALSQLSAAGTPVAQYSQVDAALYEPLVQKRVLLAKGERSLNRLAMLHRTELESLRNTFRVARITQFNDDGAERG